MTHPGYRCRGVSEASDAERIKHGVTELVLDPVRVLSLSILVLWLGNFVERQLPFLERYNIPSAVSGGLICSTVVALLAVFADVRVSFDLELRDTLLLIFFSTIGLSAKFSRLASGGRALAVLLLITILFLFAQNVASCTVLRHRQSAFEALA